MSGARVPLALVAGIALVVGGWAGLSRLGLTVAAPGDANTYHGALMVTGSVATLIGLERAIVLQRRWGLLAPLGSALTAVAVIVGAPPPVAPALALAAAVAFFAVAVVGGPVSPALARIVMSAGAAAWIAAAGVWLMRLDPFRAVPWWLLFLTLVIVGERIDLSRALRVGGARRALLLMAISVSASGVALAMWDLVVGLRVAGVGLLAVAMWMLVHERPDQGIRTHGLRRLVAVATALAYVWLAVGASFLITFDGVPAGWRYDAMVHALFVGFVLTTIYGHLALVVPAVLGLAITFRRTLYVPVAILQTSVMLRVIGDVLTRADLRDAGAVGVAISVVAAIAATGSGLRWRRTRGVRSPR